MATRCKCGYRRRGLDHDNGNHHRKWWNKLDKAAQEVHKQLAPTH